MAAPTSSNEVTVAKLSKVLVGSDGTGGMWKKVKDLAATKAPAPHASADKTYGVGTASSYGHVKLVTGDLKNETAADGKAASNAHTHSQYSLTSHTHPTSLAADSTSGTVVTLSANTQYKLTAGNTSLLLKTPGDTTYVFDGTYNASTNKAATVSTVLNAVNLLAADTVGGTSKYISQISQVAGLISATATMMDSYPTLNSTKPVESNGIKESLDGKVDYRQNTSSAVIYNSAPFSDNSSSQRGCKYYFENTVPDGTVRVVYNVPGNEYTIVFSRNRGSSGNLYGSILKWGYADNYVYINGVNNGTWNDASNFQKISAGYADSAGTASDMAGGPAASNSNSRHVWFSNSDNETKRAYSDNLTYRTDTNTISANISGKSGSVADKGSVSSVIYPHWYGDNITKVEPSSSVYQARTGTKWLAGGYAESDGVHYNVVDVNNVTVGRCMKAYQDQNGNVIDTTYMKATAINVVTADTTLKSSWAVPTSWTDFDTWGSQSSSTYAQYTIYATVTICNLSSDSLRFGIRLLQNGSEVTAVSHEVYLDDQYETATISYSLNCIGNSFQEQMKRLSSTSCNVKITHAYQRVIIAK